MLETTVTDNVEETTKEVETKVDIKPFTEEELNKKIQSETDKVRTEYSKKIKDYEAKIKELTPIQKSDEELEIEARLKALEDKEKEVQAKELELKVSETLENNGLPKQLAKYLNIQGTEDLESYLGEVKEVLTKHLNDTSLNNTYKPNSHQTTKDTITKEQFNKMSYMERLNIFKTNEELYNKLSK
ncbi:MAG: hypothetical protein E7211_00590 [Clostridium lundense]|nr:hypothetical protein [Clostridium lundense]